ncbi:uncharacterized protein LOC141823644 [Curcuma longa]|uniref:uncharacterized protein LOC141823644 n=1 Tax=Curcuma longa TaxID=136217 RepID=UPI003D9EC6EC
MPMKESGGGGREGEGETRAGEGRRAHILKGRPESGLPNTSKRTPAPLIHLLFLCSQTINTHPICFSLFIPCPASLPPHPPTPPELAIPISPEASVTVLYEAIKRRDAGALNQLLAPDLEWWFHGPPNRQHLKRLLTGEDEAFEFVPQEVAAFGSTVVAEGGGPGAAVWVHAWTVGPDGVITQVREYFNTSLTVTRVEGDARGSDDKSPGLTQCCVPVWQSQRPPKTLPGLVLAI